MDGVSNFGFDWTSFIDGVSNDVHDSAESLWPDGNTNGGTGIVNILASNQSFGGIHSNCSDSGISQMLGDFEYQSVFDSFDFKSI